MKNYLMCIGKSFYSKDDFRKEAERLGTSRRLANIPTDLVPGQSRIYIVFNATKDSQPKKCKMCRASLRSEDGYILKCLVCGYVHEVRKHGNTQVESYFVPSAVELVLRVNDDAAKGAVKIAEGLGLFSANLEETPELLRATITLNKDDKTTVEVAQAVAKMPGVEADVDMLTEAFTKNVRVQLVAREPERGCGFRQNRGIYTVSSGGSSPLVVVNPPVSYLGQHFRGLKLLTDEQSSGIEGHINGTPFVIEEEKKEEAELPLLAQAV